MSAAQTFKLENIEVHGLARRQAETLAHTALGLNSKQVARAMQVSPRTVEMQLQLVMQRLHAHNRPHLITRAVADGLLVVRRGALTVLLALPLAVASLPNPDIQPDDMLRLTARPVRTRREQDAAVPSPTEE